MNVFDLAGIGFGPANLALAVALCEDKEKGRLQSLKTIFLEKKREFSWHPNLLLEDMSIQVSFLKDLATLRNPCSPFTFLNYLKQQGRLDEFINLQEFFPTRLELNDYFKWAANQFKHQVDYGKTVISLKPVSFTNNNTIDAVEVFFEDSLFGQLESYVTRNLVVAPGGTPKFPKDISINSSSAVFHSSEFLQRIRSHYPNLDAPYRFVVVGSGQSGAEILYYLANHYPKAEITATMRGFGYRPMDDSHFINEIFFPQEVDAFYSLYEADRTKFLKDYQSINYSVVDASLIKQIYHFLYKQKMKGSDRIKILRFLELDSVSESNQIVTVGLKHLLNNDLNYLQCDGLILATGYNHRNQHHILDELSPYLIKTPSGDYSLNRNYSIESDQNFLPKIFLQGICETTHGFSDTLLSILPIRAYQVVDELANSNGFSDHSHYKTNGHVPSEGEVIYR